MSRTSVRRAINEIIEHKGAVYKCGDGYICDPNYVAKRLDADDYLPEVQDSVIAAGAQLMTLCERAKRGKVERKPSSGRKRTPSQKPK